MTTQEIANRLVTLCKTGEFATAQKELYAADAISIEPYATPAFEKETKGLDKIQEKIAKFDGMTETVHNISVSYPIVAGNSFVILLKMDITMKGQERTEIEELCVYEVKEGKIVSEQFFM
ncbi:SnoaL-like domain-containing protein [Chitinophaga agri]|uniref:Nuclear transport factor 2 family protein n=1 Tax=Chitinophaga agri TaxID=2703787 RepID=A0A6B9ZLA0_9BACT|nr:SnoaL-like domain-containing protein [Chitinophaga agri]QHS62184.1 nuclear transport factor 2 family protein [Chitinophaga agri]